MLLEQVQTSKVGRNHQVRSSFSSKYDLYFVAALLIGCLRSHAYPYTLHNISVR